MVFLSNTLDYLYFTYFEGLDKRREVAYTLRFQHKNMFVKN